MMPDTFRKVEPSPYRPRDRSTLEVVIGAFAAICAVSTAGILLGSLLAFGDATAIDRVALVAVRHGVDWAGRGWAALKQAMLLATAIGAFPALAVLTLAVAGYLLYERRRSTVIRLLLLAGSGVVAANLVKDVFGRARPDVVAHWITVSSLSFPSGHTADGSIVYPLLAVLALGGVNNAIARRCLATGAFILVILIGVSRVYLGVHWPTDVFAGWAFGCTWAFIAAPFMRDKKR